MAVHRYLFLRKVLYKLALQLRTNPDYRTSKVQCTQLQYMQQIIWPYYCTTSLWSHHCTANMAPHNCTVGHQGLTTVQPNMATSLYKHGLVSMQPNIAYQISFSVCYNTVQPQSIRLPHSTAATRQPYVQSSMSFPLYNHPVWPSHQVNASHTPQCDSFTHVRTQM